MSDSAFVAVATLADVPPGQSICVELSGREILLCHTRDGLLAVDNICTHAAARLSEGRLKGCKVFCPLHGAAFDLRDGAALTRPARTPLACYRVRVEGDDILLQAIAADGSGA